MASALPSSLTVMSYLTAEKIRAFYQSDGGSYNYDAEAEYEAYMEDTLAFDKMYYYYGMDEEAEYHIGYLDFRGWMVGEEFYLNFGYVYQE